MNRRRFLIALAVVIPLAIFVAAKIAASWRPVMLMHFDSGPYDDLKIQASEQMVAVSDTQFNLQTEHKEKLHDRMSAVGAWTWNWVGGAKPHLLLRDGTQAARSYPLPGVGDEEEWYQVEPLMRFSPATDRVELLFNGNYYRWQARSRRLQRHIQLADVDSRLAGFTRMIALTRDGETVVFAGTTAIREISTRTGRTLRRVPLRGVEFFETIRVSPFGRYALYETPGQKTYFEQIVVDTRSGRALWKLKMGSNGTDAVFSPDQTVIAVPLAKSKLWEIRDLRTGQLLRTLPFVPNTQSGAFSPDGDTLYSVANGVLYRQRAR